MKCTSNTHVLNYHPPNVAALVDPEPKISFINDSPLVTGRSVTVHLSVNHPFSMLECSLSSPSNVQIGDKKEFHDCKNLLDFTIY